MDLAHNIDLKKEVRGIRAAAGKALALCAACFAAGYLVLPKYLFFPTTTFDALVFTLRIDLFILLWVVVAVGVVSHARRQSTADIRGAAFGVPSESIKVKIAFLQNTLEQAFIAIGSHLVFSTLLAGPPLSLIIVATALFAIGRFTFYRGYPQGAAARAFGMVATVIPTMTILALSLVALARTRFAP
ncbi:MAPEG family protein [Xylophilus ampelinus]|nr:MAPEG family protein [Xylophilus ampelinus]